MRIAPPIVIDESVRGELERLSRKRLILARLGAALTWELKEAFLDFWKLRSPL